MPAHFGGLVAAFGAAGAAFGVLLGWSYLSEPWRRALSLLASLAGIAFLIAAVTTEGRRESTTVTDFLLGAPALLLPTAASASLPFYLLTGVCLLLGLVGLAVGERAAQALRERYLMSAVGLTVAVALLRFGFEKAAAPQALTRLFGVAWLPPAVGVFLYFNVRGGPRPWRVLSASLLKYALATRLLIVGLYASATLAGIGSHFDVTPVVHVTQPFEARFAPRSAEQFLALVLVPQLTLWVVYTLALGLLAALAVHAVSARPGRRPRPVEADDGRGVAADAGRLRA